jgi:pimeloyl-ACP methyl ester carboxylesterase
VDLVRQSGVAGVPQLASPEDWIVFKKALAALALMLLAPPAALAHPPGLPASFEARTIATPGAELFVQVGGSGSPVVLLHGYAESGDMWGPLAADLAKHHTVIVPDLRGLGRSSRPAEGYDKKTEARDIRAVVEALGFDQAAVVGHDLGGIVAYAYAAQYPAKVTRLVFMEAPIPGVGPWGDVVTMPALWHWNFGGPDMERLVQGRERIYFDHFWRFAADPSKIEDETRDHYAAQYAAPGAMRAGFAQFAAFAQDAKDNAVLGHSKLTMPVLAVGGEKAFGAYVGAFMRNVALDVREVVMPDTGHWLMEENPAATVALVRDFIDGN